MSPVYGVEWHLFYKCSVLIFIEGDSQLFLAVHDDCCQFQLFQRFTGEEEKRALCSAVDI
jgi:hypothetical protein